MIFQHLLNTPLQSKVCSQVARGARDFMPEQMAIREPAFSAITAVLQLHGGLAIDTPVFALKEILISKYGEVSRLKCYDQKDRGLLVLPLPLGYSKVAAVDQCSQSH